MSNIIASAEILAMSRPDLGTVLRVGGAVAALATGVFSSIKSFHKIPEGSIGLRTFNGKARNKKGEPLHTLMRPGGHLTLPFLHDVEHISLQAEALAIETTFDALGSCGKREQYRLEATALWRADIDLEDEREAFDSAFRYLYELSGFDDVQAKVSSSVQKYLIDCATALNQEDRTFEGVSTLASENIHEIDLSRFAVVVEEVELNAFHRAGVIQLITDGHSSF